MRERTLGLAAAAAAAMFAVSPRAQAQTAQAAAPSFEETVGAALGARSALKTGFTAQKSLSASAETEREQAEADAQRGPGGGGPHPTPRPPSPRPPGPRPGPHPRPAPHPNPHPTHPVPSNRHHRDWSRWPGHPGWGHHDGRWDWDRYGRPHWWGWIIWDVNQRLACRDYYGRELQDCGASCGVENSDCADACDGDGDCVKQCDYNGTLCQNVCDEDYEEEVRTCR